MAPTTTRTTADRLKARWAKQGGGPELEARLRAAKEELARRAKVSMAKARGVQLPEKLHSPVADPTDPPATSSGSAGATRAAVGASATDDDDDDCSQPTIAASIPCGGDLENSSSQSHACSSAEHRQEMQQIEPQQRAISVEAVMEEARAAAAKEMMAAAASGDPPPTLDADADAEDEELAALEAGCVEVYKKPQIVLPPQRLDPNDPVVRLKHEVGWVT